MSVLSNKKVRRPSGHQLAEAAQPSAMRAAWRAIWQQPWRTSLALLIVALMLILPTNFYLLLQNMHQLAPDFHRAKQISLYLQKNLDPAAIDQLLAALKTDPAITKLAYISPAAGLAQMQKALDLPMDVKDLNDNPLPGVILIQPKTTLGSGRAFDQLIARLKAVPDVNLGQMQITWLQRFDAVSQLLTTLVWIFSILLWLAMGLIIVNTVFGVLQPRKQDPNFFARDKTMIRRIYLSAGCFYGVFAGVIALLVIGLEYLLLRAPARDVAASYASQLQLLGLSFTGGLLLIIISVVLSLLGARLAARRHLRDL